MILDARTLLAYFDRQDDRHWATAGQLEFCAGFEELVVSPFVIPELESLVRGRYGADGWLLVLEELASEAWTIAGVGPAHLKAVRERVEGGASLAEASVAVLAEGDEQTCS